MDCFFSAFETVHAKAKDISLCPVMPGRYLICTDSGDVFYDTKDGVRKQLTDIIDLGTDTERTAILAPLDKTYFVRGTRHFWRYLDGGWVDLSESPRPSFVKTFTAADWTDGTLTIPASEHGLNIQSGAVGSNVYALVNGAYTAQAFAAVDTEVSVDGNQTVILSKPGDGFSGRVILYC